MANDECNETEHGSLPISVHQTYLSFLTSVLKFLQAPQASDEEHKGALAEIERNAVALKNELPSPHTPKGKALAPTIDDVVRFCREYYPSEGDSDELSEAVQNLTTTMAEEFGASS